MRNLYARGDDRAGVGSTRSEILVVGSFPWAAESPVATKRLSCQSRQTAYWCPLTSVGVHSMTQGDSLVYEN